MVHYGVANRKARRLVIRGRAGNHAVPFRRPSTSVASALRSPRSLWAPSTSPESLYLAFIVVVLVPGCHGKCLRGKHDRLAVGEVGAGPFPLWEWRKERKRDRG
jgi:hypothetical protein